MAEAHGVVFELGDFGKIRQQAKVNAQKVDRFPESELAETLKKSETVFPASSDPTSYRFHNKAWVSRSPEGYRFVYTRENRFGNEEIISWHSLPESRLSAYLENSLGIPSRTRTGNPRLEGDGVYPLAYGNTSTVREAYKKVKESQSVAKPIAESPKDQYNIKDDADSNQKSNIARPQKGDLPSASEARPDTKGAPAPSGGADAGARGGLKKPPIFEGGGDAANIGIFADGTPVKAGGIDQIRPVELPEMVALARDLMGQVPRVKRQIGKKVGVFWPVGAGQIELRADLFESLDQAAKTLAHEIGHLVDYLPEQTMKRGNLLGRLLTLQKFLKKIFY